MYAYSEREPQLYCALRIRQYTGRADSAVPTSVSSSRPEGGDRGRITDLPRREDVSNAHSFKIGSQ
jgi:hypothetical protein